jgi:ATP adenylyltransferase
MERLKTVPATMALRNKADPVASKESSEALRMSHIYQPVLIKTLLDNGGFCTRRQLALALLMQDESQIEYYENRLRDMPLPVLKKRGVISESDGIVRLEVDKLSLQDRASIRLE